MKPSAPADTPIFCSLEAGEFKQRSAWIDDLNRKALLSVRREGLRLILAYRPEHVEEVREMVRLERECCRFLELKLAEEPDGITVVIEAPEEVADALDTIFEPFEAASRARSRPSPS